MNLLNFLLFLSDFVEAIDWAQGKIAEGLLVNKFNYQSIKSRFSNFVCEQESIDRKRTKASDTSDSE